MKKFMLLCGPCSSRSGYGDHTRDVMRSFIENYDDTYDILIIDVPWGSTPRNALDINIPKDKALLDRYLNQDNDPRKQPDVYVDIRIPNEFQTYGKVNIGITAGIETTAVSSKWLEGCNKMDLIIVPSGHSRSGFVKSIYDKVQNLPDGKQQKVGELKLEKPIEVLFEGVDTTIFNGKSSSSILDSVETDFNFLYVGHWLSGDLGHDRKDTGMMIKTFCTVFKGLPKNQQPGLILKTSSAGFSVGDREIIKEKVEEITKEFGDKCPPIHLVWGDLSESELNDLYNDEKVKSFIMFTKGEGYGRPLAEFATTGKPIIVSKWSGHTDFLPEENTVYLDGELKEVHQSAQNKFLLPESKWFYVNYSTAAQRIFDVYKNYKTHLKKSAGLKTNINTNFTLNEMTKKLKSIVDQYVKIQQHVELKLPEIKKL